MIAVARADDQGNQVPRLHGEILDGANLHFVAALGRAVGQPLTGGAAPQFQ